jgi:hypothetical protein
LGLMGKAPLTSVPIVPEAKAVRHE